MTFTEVQSKIDTQIGDIEILDSWEERLLPEQVESLVYRFSPEAERARDGAILDGKNDEFFAVMTDAIGKFRAYLFRMKIERKLADLHADQIELDLLKGVA